MLDKRQGKNMWSQCCLTYLCALVMIQAFAYSFVCVNKKKCFAINVRLCLKRKAHKINFYLFFLSHISQYISKERDVQFVYIYMT